MVVVGSRNSSNSQRLRETASQAGLHSVLVDDASQLVVNEFSNHQHVAVTAGASAPEAAVQEVVDWFVSHFDASVQSHTFTEEHQVFPLPKELASICSSPKSLSVAKNGPMSTDVTIIGAGPGGLAAAMLLAHQGRKVRVLERMSRGGRSVLGHRSGWVSLRHGADIFSVSACG